MSKDNEKSDPPRKTKSSKSNGPNVNGGNLEDCFTNIFSLTEVNGLKWKCFRTPKNAPRGVPLTSDPILVAYSKCVKDGILCAWRRKQLNIPATHEPLQLPHFSHDMPKELWVFWYYEETEKISEYCKDLEMDDEEGSNAACSNIVSYEVRIMFFKSLHIILERSLMRIGFVRFGRWFTKPLKSIAKQMQYMYPTYTIAIRFHFFIHGGNRVCLVVNAQRQPTLIQLQKRHLEHNGKRFVVIIGPWSMRGHLVQNQFSILSESKMQASIEREYNNWKSFVVLEDDREEEPAEDVEIKKEVPEEKEKDNEQEEDGVEATACCSSSDDEDAEPQELPKKNETENQNDVPKMVLVDIDGVRMLYPSRYLSVTLEDDRHVWDALGYRVTTVPDELIVQGRKPRNKFVVQAANAHIQLQGVIQQILGPKTMISPKPPMNFGGFAQPFLPTNDEKWLKWKFTDIWDMNCEKCINGRFMCEACTFAEKRLRAKKPLTLTKEECVALKAGIFEHMKQKPDSSAYHRTKNLKTAQMIKFFERQRHLSESSLKAATPKAKKEKPKDKSKKKKKNDEESEEEEEMEEVEQGTIFRKRDDNPWLLDDEEMADWIDLNKESFPIPEHPEEEFIGEDSGGTSEDDDFGQSYSPFTPVTSVTPCGTECPWPASSLENMTENVFSLIFQQNKDRKVIEGASREEKYAEYDSYYDPTLPQIREYPQLQPYHKQRRTMKKQQTLGVDIERPFMSSTTIYKGDICEYGPLGYSKYQKKLDEEEAAKLAEERAKKPPVVRKEIAELFENNVQLAEQLEEKKSVKRSVDALVRIKDQTAHDIKKWKKKDHRVCVNSEDGEELNRLDIKKFNENFDEEFRTKIDSRVGYLSPYYQSSPSYSNYEETSETEEMEMGGLDESELKEHSTGEEQIDDEMKGLGEGTSTQQFIQQAENENELMECDISTEGTQHNSSGNGIEYGPDGLLSPPASNEMPKGGPLSVGGVADDLFPRGIPSIEAPGMNQIYPTPPSVQMLHSDPQQVHSPLGKLKNPMPSIVEDAEKVQVDGAPNAAEECSSNDEGENLEELNVLAGDDKMTKLLNAFKSIPLSKSKRKTSLPLSEKFALNSEKPIIRPKNHGVYLKMIDDAFENPPFDSFGKLLTLNPYVSQHQIQQKQQEQQQQQQQQINQQQQFQQYQQLQLQQQQQQQQQYQQMNMQYNPMQQQQHQMNQFGYPYHQQQQQQIQFSGQFSSPQHQMQYQMGAFGRGSRMVGPPPMMAGRPPPPAYAASVAGPSNMYSSSVQQLNNFVNQPRFGGPQPQSPYMAQGFSQGFPPQGYPSQGFPPQRLPPMYSQPSMPPPPGYPINPQLPFQQQYPFHQQQQQHQQQQIQQQQVQQQVQQHSQLQQQLQKPKENMQQQVPEGESIIIAIIMSDTILDLHFDTSLDSCPICSCTVSIRARELGLYITPHELLRSSNMMNHHHQIGPWSGFNINGSTTCTCGFSAIRHRYLSFCAGLFPEDSNEATALDNSVASVAPPLDLQLPGMEISKNISWFDSSSPSDLALLDQIRQLAHSHSYGKALSQMAALSEQVDRSKAMEIGFDVQSASEYVISHVDSMELLMLGNSAIDMCMKSMSIRRNQMISAQKFLTYFHPWGLQTANEIRDPNTTEWRMILNTILPPVVDSIKIARKVDADGSKNIVEGPLTWKKFVEKNRQNDKQEIECSSAAEPVPAVMFATSTETIKATPMLRTMWTNAALAPIDQPKDVMYMTIIPDDDVTYAKAVKFMEKVSKQYERMKLGRHIPFPVSSGPTQAKNRPMFSSYRKPVVETPPQSSSKNSAEPMEVDSGAGTSTSRGNGDSNSDDYDGSRNLFDGEISSKDANAPATSWDDMKKFSSEKPELSPDFYDREGILRCGGTRTFPFKVPALSAATSTEFANMVKNLNDRTGFVSRLKNYTQQMEELVFNALNDNPVAFERFGFKYQNAVEVRLKREKEAGLYASSKVKMSAMEEDPSESTTTPTQEPVPTTTTSGASTTTEKSGTTTTETSTAAEAATNKTATTTSTSETATTANSTATTNDTSSNGVASAQTAKPALSAADVPSPIPAGMVHIPETVPENERVQQPTLTDLLSEPSSLLPMGTAAIQWVQRDTTLPNPFTTSNQPPVDYEEVGAKEKDDPSVLPHVIVIYITNPFTWGTNQHTALHMRVSVLTFIRTFNSILAKLPLKRRPQVQLEVINLDQLEDNGQAFPDYLNDPKIPMDLFAKTGNKNYSKTDDREPPESTLLVETAKSLAIAVYQHPRVFFPDSFKIMQPRCMTAFGPGSQLLRTVDEMERLNQEYFKEMRYRGSMGMRGMIPSAQKNYFSYKIPSNMLCLAPPPPLQHKIFEDAIVLTPTEEQVLFVTYCLVGSDYLVAAVTDQQGKLIDNCVINMKPKHEAHQLYRYKLRTQILDAMGRLWTFILGVMASDIKNWRLVVGRLGRIGHGEFRAWTHLLNKTSLLKYSSRLKDVCAACNQTAGVVGTPSILSACLVTIEPEPNLRVIPDYIDPDAVKKTKQLHTPEDVSATHIITFPVGADIVCETQDSSNDTKVEENWEFGDLDIGLDDGDTELLKDVACTEAPTSAAIRPGGIQSFFSDETSIDIQNQPLASGYYISTSPAPELPDWFWAACPSAKRSVPVHLKSSLHINITEVKNDDLIEQATSKEKEKKEEDKGFSHPLESHQTEEVLRHVLESYNALSWLNVHPVTGERYSCMPVHIQHLLRLYHSIVRLIM